MNRNQATQLQRDWLEAARVENVMYNKKNREKL